MTSDLSRPAEPRFAAHHGSPPRLRTRVGPVVLLVATLLMLGGGAWMLKGRGVLYTIKVQLGLAKPLVAAPPPVITGERPSWGHERRYPPVDPDLVFEQVPLPTTGGTGFTCVAMGPDGRLWAASDDGRIFRFPVAADGMLGVPEVFDALQRAHGGPRLLTGFAFDPGAPAEAPVLWAAHSDFAFHDARDWSGTISRLSGSGLQSVQDIVVHLPRSVGDHATNQPAFGPDGALYIPQASNTAFGDIDETWGNRPEHLLSATILRLDVSRLPSDLPIDVKTDDGGMYDPQAPGAPVTIFATGVRLAYDLCWARDGRLYAPVNGSSAGGNVPAAPDGSAPAIRAVPVAEPDWLIRVERGGYYGHPNPRQGHYILNGANPTVGEDFAEVTQYPAGTRPDPRWIAPIANLGDHQSADGIIQYHAAGDTAAERKLEGALILCRYSFGADLVAIRLTPEGEVAESIEGIPGFTGFTNPLDVTQDPRTGYLYVSDYGAQGLVLVRPVAERGSSAAGEGLE